MEADIKTDPHNGTPAYEQPTYDEEIRYDAACGQPASVEPETVRWELSGGTNLSFGRHEPDGPLLVNLSLSDYATATGLVQRTVTREQVRDYALHLLRLVGAQATWELPEVTA